jgi:hypothetical protein
MPVETTVTTNVTCDNPACPGNALDPADPNGWLHVTSQIWGEPAAAVRVYCCSECAAADHESLVVVTEATEPPAGDGTEPIDRPQSGEAPA